MIYEKELDPAKAEFYDELKAQPQEKPLTGISPKALQLEAKQRAKQQPLIQKVIKTLRGDSQEFRELIINSEASEKRVALLVNGVLEKLDIERPDSKSMVGAIYKGKIQNLEHGLKAAFVDIGEAKNAFLHYWDIIPEANDETVEFVRDNKSESQRQAKTSIKDVPQLYPIGTDIVVQITKAQIGSKGPRTTTNIAIAGRYLVFMPYQGQCGISQKIEDRKERERLKTILRKLTLPEGMGIIIRTAGEGKKLRYFVRDLHMLLQRWKSICERMAQPNYTGLLYQEPDIIERTVRDFLTEDIDRILIDNEDDFKQMHQLIQKVSPFSKSKLGCYEDSIPIFERFNIERQIEQTFMRRVPLPSGGEIVIEETEALTSVDVNTGSHKVLDNDGKNFIYKVNLEAAKEICRQIKLRNIGGLIIIDFIDMKHKHHRNHIYSCMLQEMSTDRAKTQLIPISALGILQMSRQRYKENTSSGIYSRCTYCNGRGMLKSARTMSIHIQRRIISLARQMRKNDKGSGEQLSLRIFLNPSILEHLRNEDEALLLETERLHNLHLSFRADPSYHMENFKIMDVKTQRELT
jgi:ribonuclease G